ncbi:MAG: site-specific integrase [Trueperaceae bacterium]|nr:site-specific integrase [Trueperaceae bacterium]
MTNNARKKRKPRGRRRNHEGTITLRKDGRYQVAFPVGRTSDGKIKRLYRYASTEDQAEQIRLDLAYRHSRGDLALGDATTFRVAAMRWLRVKESSVQPQTHHSYRHLLEKHTLPYIGEIPLRKLAHANVEDLMVSLDREKVGRRTRKLVLWLARRVVGYCVDNGLLDRSPVRSVDLPRRTGPSPRRAWTADEARRFLEAATGDRLHLAFYLMLLLGLRRGELLGLSWSSIDLEHAALNISQSLRKSPGGGLEIADPKTESSRRRIHLPSDAIVLLANHREHQNEERRFAGDAWRDDHDLVFRTSLGTPIHPDNLKRSLKRICLVADVPVIRIHDLRHTHASLALQWGLDDKVLSERLGHTDVSFTRRVYQHTYEEQHRRAALSMQELFGRPSKGELLSD